MTEPSLNDFFDMPDVFHWKCEKFNKQVSKSFLSILNTSTGYLPFRLESSINKVMFEKSAEEFQKLLGNCFVIIDDSQNQQYDNYIRGMNFKF
jgi:hypothetical protein